MGDLKNKNNGGSLKVELAEFALKISDKLYRIDASKIIQAFDRAEVKSVLGKHSRYYIRIDGEMKPVVDVFTSIVPVTRNEINNQTAELISTTFKALGFEILDRHRHHEM